MECMEFTHLQINVSAVNQSVEQRLVKIRAKVKLNKSKLKELPIYPLNRRLTPMLMPTTIHQGIGVKRALKVGCVKNRINK